MKAIVNIGMWPGRVGVTLPQETVRSMLDVLRIKVRASRVDVPKDGSEPTFIASVDHLTKDKVKVLADVLHQDCIAVWWSAHEKGELIGPHAAEWGEWDSALFKLI